MAIKILKSEQVKKLSYNDKKKSLNDGGGLRIVAKKDGRKVWLFKYSFNGKQKDTTLGTFPKVSLAMARTKANEFTNYLEKGEDPLEIKKNKKIEVKHEKLKKIQTIEKITDRYFEIKQHNENLADITIKKLQERIQNHIYPYLSNKKDTSIHDINYDELVKCLSKLENDGKLHSLARIKNLVVSILKYAYTENIINDVETFTKLDMKKFKKQKKSDIRNNPTFTKKEDIKKLYNEILKYNGNKITFYATLFSIHTIQRQGTIITAEWNDIDLDKKIWTIPSSKMKMKRNHILPLSDYIVKLLKELYKITGKRKYIFPNSKDFKHMSNNTVRLALRRMGFTNNEQTPHGFRAMFKTICTENQEQYNLKREYVELVLAHKIYISSSEEQYDRSYNIEDMRYILNWWSNYLENLLD